MLLQSFAPVVSPQARVLVLGSLPGTASLVAQEYYAHPRNAFWPIMQRLLGFPAGLPYASRLVCLQQGGVALWDVARECERPGSLDAAIRHHTVVPNDIAGLLVQYPGIHLIACNGQSVQALFRRHVLPVQSLPGRVQQVVLPSSSPANARLDPEQKYRAWAAVLAPVLP